MTASGNFKQVPYPRRSIGGFSPLKFNMKHYESVDISSNFQNDSPPAQV